MLKTTLMSVAHDRLCLGSIFSIVPVKNSNASVVLFDIETITGMCLMCLSKRMSFFHCSVSLASGLSLFYEPRKDLEALSSSNKIDKTGYRSCHYY